MAHTGLIGKNTQNVKVIQSIFYLFFSNFQRQKFLDEERTRIRVLSRM